MPELDFTYFITDNIAAELILETDINVNTGTIIVNDADVDPWIFGIGIGYTF